MAGTIQPIAALTAEDHGPINTIVSIVLPSTSALIAVVRISMRRQKYNKYESDDIVFGVGFGFAILISILSYFCVRAGLGKHQETLDEEEVNHYFKLFWTTQIIGVITLAFAKLSLVLLYKRLTPKQTGLRAATWLLPVVAIYTVLCLGLIAFQCQLPQPWILSPSRCSTHGDVYYPITILNMVTDAMLAVWMLPLIYALHMRADSKSIVMWLFGSRLVICVVDIGRMIVIHRALQSEDQTRSQLLWAIMDQLVVHLSITHSTLPRIQTFLANLQIGGISLPVEATSHVSKTAQPTSNSAWTAFRVHLTSNPPRTSTSNISTSELPLRERENIELSTIVYTGKGEFEQRNTKHSRSGATSLSSEGLDRDRNTRNQGGVRVQKDVSVTYDYM